MDNDSCAQKNVMTNGSKPSLNHNESEKSLGPDHELDTFYEFPHNHFDPTMKREAEKRYLNGP
jgi:hypothetical protein